MFNLMSTVGTPETKARIWVSDKVTPFIKIAKSEPQTDFFCTENLTDFETEELMTDIMSAYDYVINVKKV